MQIEIFNVGLGQCAVIHCPNGKKLMIDAGHNASEEKPWRPSIHFWGQEIDWLFLSNYDEDHASDIDGVMKYCTVNAIIRNPTVNSNALLLLKAQAGFGAGIERIYHWMCEKERTVAASSASEPYWGGVTTHSFWNPYPHFDNTNDLSVATFVEYGNFCILFAGDLETKGWQNLASQPSFLAKWLRVSVLVAAHHGRENGCCEELFALHKSDIVIISDKQKIHDTQETVDWYANRCRGIPVLQEPGKVRKVFTTRKDGHLTLNVAQNGRWIIYSENPVVLPVNPLLPRLLSQI